MKRLLAITTAALILGAAATRVYAEESWTPMLSKGTKEVAVAGNVEFLEIDEVNYNVDLSYGYFVRDGWELGATVGGSGLGGSHTYGIGVFTEYNFNRDKKWVPFVGAGIGVANVSYDDSLSTSTTLDDESGTIFDVEAGIKYFLRPCMAISTSFAFQVASTDLFATDESIEDNITLLKIGMRFYL